MRSWAVTSRAWLQAARLPSQAYLWLPLAWGQALAYRHFGSLDLRVGGGLMAYGLCQQLYIVFANDVADRKADALNTTPTLFSGGSRVLVEGRLSWQELACGALVVALLSLSLAIGLAILTGETALVAGACMGLGLLWAYSYPPLRLSYRGGGEFLQCLGLGLLLPWMGYAAQAGLAAAYTGARLGVSANQALLAGLAVIMPAQLACALATALPDEKADRLAGKQTLVVAWGLRRTLLLMGGLQAMSLLAWQCAPWQAGAEAPLWGLAGAWFLMALFLGLGVPPAASRRLVVKAAVSLAFNLWLMLAMIVAWLG